jgi:hypothetical protein
MSDAGWTVTEPALAEPAWKQGRGGRPAQRCRRDTVGAMFPSVRLAWAGGIYVGKLVTWAKTSLNLTT